MKTLIFAAALMIGGVAVAQTSKATDPVAEPDAQTTTTTTKTTEDAATTTADPMPVVSTPVITPASTQVVEPSNADPELDARGIPVISDPATVPPGFNGIGGAVGGPLEPIAADAGYPACTAELTDNCLQTYEKGRSD